MDNNKLEIYSQNFDNIKLVSCHMDSENVVKCYEYNDDLIILINQDINQIYILSITKNLWNLMIHNRTVEFNKHNCSLEINEISIKLRALSKNTRFYKSVNNMFKKYNELLRDVKNYLDIFEAKYSSKNADKSLNLLNNLSLNNLEVDFTNQEVVPKNYLINVVKYATIKNGWIVFDFPYNIGGINIFKKHYFVVIDYKNNENDEVISMPLSFLDFKTNSNSFTITMQYVKVMIDSDIYPGHRTIDEICQDIEIGIIV